MPENSSSRRSPGDTPSVTHLNENALLRRRLSRRQVLRLAGRGAAALASASLLGRALTACSPQKDVATPVKIGYIPITDATPLLIAHAKGFFTEEGLTVERPILMRGWSELSEAFMARKFNLVHLLLPIPIFMRYSLNYPVKVVAWDHLNNSAVTVHGQGGIASLADLGGRKIAVPYWYSMHNVVLQLALRSHGLQAVIQDRDEPLAANQVSLLVMKPPDMPTALGSGAIDGYIVAEPFNAAGELLAGGKIIRFTGDIWKNHPCCVAVLHEDSITANRAWSQKVVNAVVKAELWAKDNKEATARILSRDGEGYLPLPENIIRRSMIKYDLETYGTEGTGAIRHPEWGISRIGFEPYPFRADTRRMVDLLKETVIEGDAGFLADLSPDHVADDLMDYEMVTAAAEAVGGLALFDGVDPASPYEREVVIEV
ncbi:MAG: ABC transporter substrate-binding protein [Anaerolineae bacterium]|nr:ABC transporter substrate-binding protein [Anaerolineae bacterium]